MRPRLALDWLRAEWASGRPRKAGWTEVDEQQLETLRLMYLEWERLAASGPPTLNVYVGFLDRFVVAYNDFYRGVSKAICVRCFEPFTFEARRSDRFCSRRCQRIYENPRYQRQKRE